MLYTTLTIGEKEYKLRLNARNCVELEHKLGESPLNMLMDAGNGKLPSLEKLLTVLHYSLQEYQHGISFDDVYDLYDLYCANGGGFTGLLQVVMDIYKSAGYIADEKKEKKPAKGKN